VDLLPRLVAPYSVQRVIAPLDTAAMVRRGWGIDPRGFWSDCSTRCAQTAVYVEAGEVLRCAAPETLTRPRPPSPSSCDDRDGRAICVPPSWPLMPANGVGGPRSTMVRARAEPGPATCLSSAASGHLFPQDPTTPATSHAVPWNPRCWERLAIFCAALAADVVH